MSTTYYVRGKQDRKVQLSDADYVASGGEKSVYAKSGTAYCVYHDPNNAVPIGKFDELKAVKHKGFVGPKSLLLDSQKRRVGETMPFVKKSFVLCQLFANSFRRKHAIDHDTDLKLISKMIEIMNAAHAAGVTLVDANDMNWLVSLDFKEVFLIDTTSCQTPSHAATAIKPAIFDPHCNKSFGVKSDYYSMAVVIAWLWCGVHPFCCQHKGSNDTMEEKMLSGLSVFSKSAELNAACRSPHSMPKKLGSWVKSCLESEKRSSPPAEFGGIVSVPAVMAVESTDVSVVAISKHTLTNSLMIFDEQTNTKTEYENGVISRGGLKTPFACDHAFSYLGQLFAVVADQLLRVDVRIVNNALRTSTAKIAALADVPNATLYGENCIVQDLLGRKVVTTPDGTLTIKLEKETVLFAVYKRGVLMMSTVKSNQAHRHVFLVSGSTVNEHHSDVSNSPVMPNFIVTRKGIVVENNEGKLSAWHIGKYSNQRTASIKPDMKMGLSSDMVVGESGGTIYSIKMN